MLDFKIETFLTLCETISYTVPQSGSASHSRQ